MIRICRRILSVAVATTMSIPSTGFGQPSSDSKPRAAVLPLEAADDFKRMWSDLDKAGTGQIKDSIGPDRFLLMQQTVYRREVPVARTLPQRTFRKWRLKALIGKTQEYLSQLTIDPSAQEPPGENLNFAKELFTVYAQFVMRTERDGNRVHAIKAAAAQIASIATPDEASQLILSLLPVTEERAKEAIGASDPSQRLENVLNLLVKTATFSHIDTGRRVDTPLFLWEAKTNPWRLRRILTSLQDTLARWKLNERVNAPNPTEAPYTRKVRYVNWWDTSIEIQEGDRVVGTLRMADTARGLHTNNSQPYSCLSEHCRFNIKDKDGTVLHVYGIKAKAVATFKQYVVFTHAGGYDAESGVEYLLFLDLGNYNGLIGNDDIPVFRRPVPIAGGITSLAVKSGKLVANGSFEIGSEALAEASELQQPVANLTANLLDPDGWGKVLPLVDALQDYMQKTIDHELKNAAEKKANLESTGRSLVQIGRELQGFLEAQKRIKPLSGEEKTDLTAIAGSADTSPALATAMQTVQQFHSRVSQLDVIGESLKSSHERLRLSRKMGARVRLLASALVSPRPYASQYIKQALGSWYVRREGGAGTNVMDRLLRLTDRPYVNAGVLAAGAMAAVAPETLGVMTDAALGVGNSVLDYVVFCLSGVSQAGVAGGSASLSPFWDLGSSLYNQYIADGALARTSIGIPAFITVLAGLYFIPHLIFNTSQLLKDLRQPGATGFVDRQKRFVADYYERLARDEGIRRDTGVTFTPDEDARARAWAERRRQELASGGFLRNLGSRMRQSAEWAAGTILSPFQSLIEASMESQTEDILQALERAEQSPAVKKAETDSPENYWNWWAATKQRAFGEALGDGPSELSRSTRDYLTAAKDFVFSMPSIELTLERWAKIWNEWAMWRFGSFGWAYHRVLGTDVPLYIKFKAVSFASKLLYPDFQRTVALRRTGQVVIPTALNGGTGDRVTRAWDAVAGSWASGHQDAQVGVTSEEAGMLLGTSPNWNPEIHLKALSQFEDQIIEVEKEVGEIAFRAALKELAGFLTDKEDLRKLFNSRVLDNIVHPDIQELSWKAQTFLRTYYESVYQAAMKKFLGSAIEGRDQTEPAAPVREEVDVGVATLPPEAVPEVDPNQDLVQLSLIELKNRLARRNIAADGTVPDYDFDLPQAKAAAVAVANDPVHGVAAREAVARGRLSVSNATLNSKYKLIANYDPTQNPSMARVEVVHRRLQSPGALGRAVRAEISKLLLTVPIELSARLLLTAGVMEGAMKPIQEHFWGPNSIFYLSETSFYVLMASGFFMSMMSEAWLKLQTDARHDELGNFGRIPQGEDAHRSFLRWYYKQFSDPDNSILKNWAFSNYVSFWNMPAAIPNILLFYFMFSGRLDFSLIATMYILGFSLPLSALHYKIDQAFELAVHHVARGIEDEKWLAHPDVQRLIVPLQQKLRFLFTLFNDIYGTAQGDILSNMEFQPTPLGPRGLQRALFGGGLLEEYIINGVLDPARNAVAGVPVLDHTVGTLIKGCRFLLSNGNPDLRIGK